MSQSDMNDMMQGYLSRRPKDTKRVSSSPSSPHSSQGNSFRKNNTDEDGSAGSDKESQDGADALVLHDERSPFRRTLDSYAVKITSLFRKAKKTQPGPPDQDRLKEPFSVNLPSEDRQASEEVKVDKDIEQEFEEAERLRKLSGPASFFRRAYASILGKNWEEKPPRFITEKVEVEKVSPEVSQAAKEAKEEMQERKEEKEKEEKVAGVLSELLKKVGAEKDVGKKEPPALSELSDEGPKPAEESPSPPFDSETQQRQVTYRKVVLYKPEMDRDIRHLLSVMDSMYPEIPEEIRKQFEGSEEYPAYQELLRKYKIKW